MLIFGTPTSGFEPLFTALKNTVYIYLMTSVKARRFNNFGRCQEA